MRKTLTAIALAAAMFSAACSGSTTSSVSSAQLAQAESDFATIASAIAADAPSIVAVAGGNASEISSAAAAISSAASAMSSVTTTEAAQSDATIIEQNLNTLVDAAAQYQGLPSNISTDLQAAAVLLPVAEAGLGMIENSVTSSSSSAAAPAASAPPMSAIEARLILKAAGSR